MSGFTRNCPTCDILLIYSTKGNCISAENKKRKCLPCGQKYSKYNKTEGRKIAQTKVDKSIYKTDEFRLKMSSITSGNKNAMFGKTVYSIWLEKYGQEEADKKLINMKAKQSKKALGKRNAMYGKPSPNGSGNGWAGWYKDWYFRSLKELSYVIKVLEKEKLSWTSAENIRIKYISPLGTERSYSPDFLIEGKKLVEVKPLKLQNTPLILAKSKAAIEYCNKNNLTYEIIDIEILSIEEIRELRNSGKIKFLDRYELKYKEKYESVRT